MFLDLYFELKVISDYVHMFRFIEDADNKQKKPYLSRFNESHV